MSQSGALALSIWKVHNPRAAIPACTNKLDNMEPYGRIPMLAHASHGTGAPAICCNIAKRPRPGKQRLSPRNPPLREESQGKQLPPYHKSNNTTKTNTTCTLWRLNIHRHVGECRALRMSSDKPVFSDILAVCSSNTTCTFWWRNIHRRFGKIV
jgi:hypothetical protein